MEKGPERKGLTRRDALKSIAAASLSAMVGSNEAMAGTVEYLPSSLEPKELDAQRTRSADELVTEFWNQPEARMHITRSYLHKALDRNSAREELLRESTMYIPTPEQCADVVARNSAEIDELTAGIPKGKFGLLLDGDKQRLYVIKRTDAAKAQFVKGYIVSTSKGDWSNAPDSKGTPLGNHSIAALNTGMLGQLVSSPQRGARDFAQIPVHEHGHTTKKSFAHSLESTGDSVAEIVTTSLLLVGERTPSTRGIFIHGTNRVDRLGQTASGGCVRTSNVDIHDLISYVQIGKLQGNERSAIGGTPVMICGHNDIKNPRASSAPPHWNPPADIAPQAPAPKSEPETETPRPPRKLPPPRWNPPE